MKHYGVQLFLASVMLSATVYAQFSDVDQAERRMIEFAIRRGHAVQLQHSPVGSIGTDNYKDHASFLKSYNTFSDARLFLMNGNQIVGNIYDYGGIAPGLNGLIRNTNNMVWRGLGDLYQFGPFVGAHVTDTSGKSIPILSDAVNDVNARDISPLDNHVYGWKSLTTGYVDPASNVMASNPAEDRNGDGKPDSWSNSWYNVEKGQFVWPGYLKQDVPNADLEVLWAMDDNLNDEFHYVPIPSDSSKKGLGVKIEGRALQWSNSLAQNCIFFVYTVQNFSEKDLEPLYAGMYGDIDNGGGVSGGGGGIENQDDLAYFVSPLDSVHRVTGVNVPVYSRSIVYFWDADGKGYQSRPAHYDACKFLESPGNSNDLIDNDGDGMIDESQTNGIDDDGDWHVQNHDVGIDGVPGTNDQGEGNGIPDRGLTFADGTIDPLHPGEPNFELTDLDEADQIGLTAFRSFEIGQLEQRNDTAMWNQLERGFRDMDNIPTEADIAFIYGSGKISLKKKGEDGSVKRFSIALLMGWTLNDILISARTVQLIYNQNYQFIRPPDKPVVTAVPGDKKVTLLWDSGAEESVDPILGKDFEGYVIYRSLSPQFTDINTITDGFGTPLLYTPLTDYLGKPARWDIAVRPEPFFEDDTSSTKNGVYDPGERYIDVNENGGYDATLVEDYWKGFAPVPFDQRGVSYYLGDNTGLQHSYVDSFNVVNGQKYYYAVVSYDHGDNSSYPPSESTKRISVDPITSQLAFDVNTVEAVPGPRSSGYIPPEISSQNFLTRVRGTSDGILQVKIVNDLDVRDKSDYLVEFADSLLLPSGTKNAQVNYRVKKVTPTVSEVTISDSTNVKIGHPHVIVDDAFSVKHAHTQVQYIRDVDYFVDTTKGFIRKSMSGAMSSSSGPYSISYRYYSQPPSTLMANEDANPVFDGLKMFVENTILALDTSNSNWLIRRDNTKATILPAPQVKLTKLAPFDIQFIFNSTALDTAGKYIEPGDSVGSASNQFGKVIQTPFRIVNATNDSAISAIDIPALILEPTATKNNRWDFGENIVVLTPLQYREANGNSQFQIRFDSVGTPDLKDAVFQIVTIKPFSGIDQYSFSTVGASFSSENAASQMDRIKVVPNPYVAVNEIEPTDRLPGTTRGSRRIYFEHLPRECTIRIYTVSGELVKELHHSVGIENGREYWDLLNRDNIGVAYGIYIAHIDAPGVGEKILKFAVIK